MEKTTASMEMLIALGTPRTQVHVSQERLGPCPDTYVPSPGEGEAPRARNGGVGSTVFPGKVGKLRPCPLVSPHPNQQFAGNTKPPR